MVGQTDTAAKGGMHDPSRGPPAQTLVFNWDSPPVWADHTKRMPSRLQPVTCAKPSVNAGEAPVHEEERSAADCTIEMEANVLDSPTVGMTTNNVEKRGFHRKLAVLPTVGR